MVLAGGMRIGLLRQLSMVGMSLTPTAVSYAMLQIFLERKSWARRLVLHTSSLSNIQVT